jgi:hypothetical protein
MAPGTFRGYKSSPESCSGDNNRNRIPIRRITPIIMIIIIIIITKAAAAEAPRPGKTKKGRSEKGGRAVTTTGTGTT